MSNITGGRVVFGRTVQPASYESKKAEVELSFALAEGEELGDTLEDYMKLAQDEVLATLGVKR